VAAGEWRAARHGVPGHAAPLTVALVGLGAQEAGHLGFKNLLHGALTQIAEKNISAQSLLPPSQNLNTLSLRAISVVLLVNVVLVNNILRNRPSSSLCSPLRRFYRTLRTHSLYSTSRAGCS
jgi:hypothetical protein